MGRFIRIGAWVAGLFAVSLAQGSGFNIWQGQITNNNVQIVLAAGSVTVAEGAGISYRGMSSDSASNFKPVSASNFAFDAGTPDKCTTHVLSAGISEFELCLNNDGSVTLQRTVGSETIDIVLRLMWI